MASSMAKLGVFELPITMPMPVLSSFLTVTVVLVLSTIVRLMSPSHEKIPIALQDEMANHTKRVDQYRFDSRNVLVQAYSKFKNQIFGINTSEGTIMVLPTHFMDELKSHPALSFAATFDSLTLPQYTGIKAASPEILKLFLGKFNPLLGVFMPSMQTMFQRELKAALPTGKDWKPVKIYHILFRLVCKSAARALLGEEAAENDRWLQVEAEYINTAIEYIQALKKWPKVMRPLVYHRVEGYAKLRKQWNEGMAIVADYMAKKRANNWEPLQDPPSLFDLITLKYKDLSVEDHFSMQITFFVAGVHTSAASSTQAIFDAAVNGNCIDEVRKEIQEVHKLCGGSFTRQHLAQLPKLDSFMKEVLRFSSPDLATFVRKASDDVVLSNGFRIPNGTKLEVATGAIAMDKEKHANAKTFDGLRFWRKRQVEDQAAKHQFTSVSHEDLEWGYGRHACPGRYMAEITIKLILIHIFLHYEIKNPQGVARYENMEFDGQTMPNTEGEVLIREFQG